MKIEELSNWDWTDQEKVRDGYDWTTVPKCTQANFIQLATKVNELINEVNTLKGAGQREQ